ncbi:MAG: hypothetical protein MRY64_15810 [Hyphomonadaceae bacterium]|nr:hypothetical protein [Hyphomonadaceae bacterium]
MIRYCLGLVACLMATACVTPITVEQQTPALDFGLAAPSTTSPVSTSLDAAPAEVAATDAPKILVAVTDARLRTLEGKPENMIGYLRVYGIPQNWTVKQLGQKDLPNDATASDLLESRISLGLINAGLQAAAADVENIEDAGEIEALLEAEGGDRLLFLKLTDWHVDVNTSWVGRFQFNHDTDLAVLDAAGVLVEKNFAEREAIQAEGDKSWMNMVLEAFRDQMQEMLSDEEVQAALVIGRVEESAPEPVAEIVQDEAIEVEPQEESLPEEEFESTGT